MNDLDFGITMTIVGVGGTFLTLWILSLVMTFLAKLFPVSTEEDKTQKKA